ncbi:MAG TPA: M14 family metallopeptidase [Pseudobdellovibrionaceae bacterium]|nr:M14 family metallopeptidase [Pseudobdellovibrionaceae bacterium]
MQGRKFIVLGLSALALILTVGATQKDNNKYWLKIKANNKYERTQIANAGIAIETSVDGWVYAYGSSNEKSLLEKAGLLDLALPSSDFFNLLDFPSKDSNFHNYAELTEALQNLVRQNPQIAQLYSIGKSHEGREIWAVQISGQINEASQLPGIIYMGGHHAREHLSVETPLGYIKYLLESYNQGNERIQALVNSRDIHIIPAVNPDGLEFDVASGRYQMWRKNRKTNGDGTFGVDLNRNYGFMWGTGGSSKNTSSDIYMGKSPFSEPETQAIKNYVETHKNITILLSFHTFSELILYPWGHKYNGIENLRDQQVHATMAAKMAEWNRYSPQQSSELYIASGDTTDWSYGTYKIISFTFELDPTQSAGGGGGGFYPGDEIIPNVIQKNLEPVLYLLEHADNPYRVLDTRISPIVPL